MRSICLFSLVCCLFNLILLESRVDAAIFSGEIQSISADQQQVVIKTSGGKEKSFTVPASIPITFNGKTAAFDQFKTGQRATVFTDSSGKITRFSVRESLEPKTKPPVERPRKEMKTSQKAAASDASPAGNQGWTQFRGPNRANISTETGLLKDWSQNPR